MKLDFLVVMLEGVGLGEERGGGSGTCGGFCALGPNLRGRACLSGTGGCGGVVVVVVVVGRGRGLSNTLVWAGCAEFFAPANFGSPTEVDLFFCVVVSMAQAPVGRK